MRWASFVFKIALSATMIATAIACSSVSVPRPKKTDIKSGHILTTMASQGHILVMDPDDDFIVCSAPHPDAAFDQADGGDLNVALVTTGNDQGAVSENSQELELSGRSPALLISRELMFRACEFSHNQKLTKAEALDLYKTTLSGIMNVWSVEAENTKVSVSEKTRNIEGDDGAPISLVSSPGPRRRSSGDSESNDSYDEGNDENDEDEDDEDEDEDDDWSDDTD